MCLVWKKTQVGRSEKLFFRLEIKIFSFSGIDKKYDVYDMKKNVLEESIFVVEKVKKNGFMSEEIFQVGWESEYKLNVIWEILIIMKQLKSKC